MNGKHPLAGLALAALIGGCWLTEPSPGLAGTPAPLPIQIPIRSADEPPTPAFAPQPVVAAPPSRRHRRPVRKRRHHVARRRTIKKQQPTKNVVTTTAPAKPLPKLQRRPEAATESILPLDLPALPDTIAPTKGGKTPEATPEKPPLPPNPVSGGPVAPEPKPAASAKPAPAPNSSGTAAAKPATGAAAPAAAAKP